MKPLKNLYKNGDVVRYGDSIALQNAYNKQFYIHLSSEAKSLENGVDLNASEALTYFKIKYFSTF